MRGIRPLIEKVLRCERKKVEQINVVFVDDREIRRLHRHYLGHDCVTDVMSFPLDEGGKTSGEVYICLNQAARQAKVYGVSEREELFHLVIHGVLHLLGYKDDTPGKKRTMRELENKYLAWRNH